MYFVFTRMPGESYRRRLRSLLLYFYYVFRTLINSLVCWFCSFSVEHVSVVENNSCNRLIEDTSLFIWYPFGIKILKIFIRLSM